MSITAAKTLLDRSETDILLVVNEADVLLGVVTDYDIRTGVLNQVTLDQPIAKILNPKPFVLYERPPDEVLMFLMDHVYPFKIGQIPILDEQGRVRELILKREISNENIVRTDCAPSEDEF